MWSLSTPPRTKRTSGAAVETTNVRSSRTGRRRPAAPQCDCPDRRTRPRTAQTVAVPPADAGARPAESVGAVACRNDALQAAAVTAAAPPRPAAERCRTTTAACARAESAMVGQRTAVVNWSSCCCWPSMDGGLAERRQGAEYATRSAGAVLHDSGGGVAAGVDRCHPVRRCATVRSAAAAVFR